MLGGSALARAPKLGTQTPYWHRFMLGDAEVTVVSDGPLPLGDPSGTFTGVPKEEVKKMLSDHFLSPDNVVLEQNSPIVNTGDKLILFDTGMGTSKAFGPTTGPSAEEHGGGRHQAWRHRRRGAARTRISITSAASSATTASRYSRTRSTTSPRAISTSGPMKASWAAL